MFEIANPAKKAINIIEENGYDAWLVGGCVRDLIMEKVPADWDITTTALPNEILRIFNDYKTVEIGVAHGTVAVIIDEICLEITTLRTEGAYTDFRHPQNVNFTQSLSEDLSRRDFTMNAIAYSPKDGIVDIFCGIQDIKNKIIRCVGNPNKRFQEDGLRIIRALRFAAVLGFDMHEDTLNAVNYNKKMLSHVAKERQLAEMNKLILGKFAYQVLINSSEVFMEIIPEINMANFEEIANVILYLPYDLIARWGAVFQIAFNGDFQKAQEVMRKMRFDNFTIKNVRLLIENQNQIPETKLDIKKLLAKLKKDNFLRHLEIIKAKKLINEAKYIEIYTLPEIIMKNRECISIKDLKINGNDLKLIGFKGKKIGEILDLMLEEVMAEKIKNNEESLIDFANKMRK